MRRFSRLDISLGIRLALSAVLAMVIARTLGLHAFYWAGISAIVVSTGTPGGSFTASLMRCGGTMIGLGAGVLLVWLLGHSLFAAALAIPLAILLCQLVGLKSAVKVAALSTLFPITLGTDIHGLSATMILVGSRAENVVVGCLVTLLIDGLIWPERMSSKLAEHIRKDVVRVGRLGAELLESYAANRSCQVDSVLTDLQKTRLTYSDMLKEIGSEPEEPDAPRERLALNAEIVHLLVDHCAALRDIQRQAEGDRVQELLRSEIETLALTLRKAAEAFSVDAAGFDMALERLRAAGNKIVTGYETIRGDKGTLGFSSQEVFRLLGVLYLGGAIVKNLDRLQTSSEPMIAGE